MPNESYGFFASGAPSVKFLTIGTTVTGTITDEPKQSQQTDPKDGSLKTWNDGNPMMQLVVPMQTTQRDPENPDDDGSRRLFVASQGMRQAISQAVTAAGCKGLDIGGRLTLVYTGDGEKTNPALNAPKIFSAHYEPPKSDGGASFLGTANPAAAAAAASTGNGAGSQAGTVGQVSQPVTPQQVTSLPAGMTQQVWDSLPAETRSALLSVTSNAAPEVKLPPGMTMDVWNGLTPEARSALANITP